MRLLRVAIASALLALLGLAILHEMRASRLQAALFATIGRRMSFALEAGPAPAPLRAPAVDAPYDARLGYSHLSRFTARLSEAGYAVDAQARPSPWLSRVGAWGLFPPYREKGPAGLRVTDRAARTIYEIRFPERTYESFEVVPALVIASLLFVENRELLDAGRPEVNPAIDWQRVGKAVGIGALNRLGREGQVIGASTLATQIEKFRHSPEGRTRSAGDKLGQMVSASLRVYLDGTNTVRARQSIATDYLNSMPLAAVAGRGEVLGLGDGLSAWYGADFAETNRLLANTAPPWDAARARAYKQVLSLILAARRPNHYLTESQPALESFTDSYLRVMAHAGVIDSNLRDVALGVSLGFNGASPAGAGDWGERKGANLIRTRLTGLLGVPALYDLDRLDLTAQSTLDGPTQEAVSRLLLSLRDPATVQALGLKAVHMLDRGDPSRVIYSFTLYERGPRANLVRVQTDSFDQPLDINAGARLDLGSTAKLRTLITYLELIADLHARYASRAPGHLRSLQVHPKDRLTAWAVDYLASTPAASLPAMLEAAMERRYSASPFEPFFTGSGLQEFHNFNADDDRRIVPVREGFRQSINLVFIRLMRDIVDHHLYEAPASLARVLEDPDDPRRQQYLTRFADREGSEFIRRFYRKYAGKSAEQQIDLALGAGRQTPRALSIVLRSLAPEADAEVFKTVVAGRLAGERFPEPLLDEVFDTYSPSRFSLMDRGFIARVHPLELWLAAYLRQHPAADQAEVLAASAAERQEVYGWLFKTERRHAQDSRIRSLLEVQAFLEIQRSWQRLGYPFASVTPSLASAIGSSGDRPGALARLMGIIVNDGVNVSPVLIEQLEFAAATPYETRFSRTESAGEQVLAPEIASVVRRALVDVVEGGTARGVRTALERPGGGRFVVGGKTGTGDHRYETFGPGRRLIESRVVDRAATFVFMIDDRFFGTLTAYVAGPEAARYEFTSALPVRLLALLMPTLTPLLTGEPPAQGLVPARVAAPVVR